MGTSLNDKAVETQSMNNVGTSYLLWLACVLQLHGLHRFYNKKYATGILWMCTFGLFWVGQFVDLFLMSRMVEDHNHKLRAKLGLSAQGILLSSNGAIALTVTPPTPEELTVKLVKAAAKRGGKLSVTQAVMDTGVNFAEVEVALKQMVKSGYVYVDNHPETGVVIYDFVEL
jgi:hypothetical protein